MISSRIKSRQKTIFLLYRQIKMHKVVTYAHATWRCDKNTSYRGTTELSCASAAGMSVVRAAAVLFEDFAALRTPLPLLSRLPMASDTAAAAAAAEDTSSSTCCTLCSTMTASLSSSASWSCNHRHSQLLLQFNTGLLQFPAPGHLKLGLKK